MRSLFKNNQYVIDVSKSWHIAWWAAELGVPQSWLVEAVVVVGNQARDVEEYLSLHKAQRARQRHREVSTFPHGFTLSPRHASVGNKPRM
jgi:hypothetical protein